jgi:fructosamine-3-kinase
MSRTGVEAKLPWKDVPPAVRQQVEAAFGARVVRGTRVWGGYGPTPTYRLGFANGRRAFFKATYQASNAFATSALRYEIQVYQELHPLLEHWMPRFFTTVQHADWYGILLEDVGPKSVPPWTPHKTRAITHALATFHQASLGAQVPAWLARPQERLRQVQWTQMAQDSEEFHRLAALAADAAPEVRAWFQAIAPTMEAVLRQAALYTAPYAILHGDLRSDNLRFTRDHLSLFDWPAISVGRPEWDIVAFAQTVTVEGGVVPEQVIAWYAEQFPVNGAAMESALAWWLTYFADRAWRPDIPGLPRVRRFQRQQLGTLVLWVARQWVLPQPAWASYFLD